MRKSLTVTVVAVAIGATLWLTAVPAQAYKVIERRVEVKALGPTFTGGTPVAFVMVQPTTNGTPVVFTTTQPASNGTPIVFVASQPIAIPLTVAANGQQLVPVEVTIRERHRHRILGLVARHHWRTRTEIQWVPIAQAKNGKAASQTATKAKPAAYAMVVVRK